VFFWIALKLHCVPRYLISYYATFYVGAIVVNFNPLYTPEELTALVKQTIDFPVPNLIPVQGHAIEK